MATKSRLTDLQKFVMSSGKKMAKELGLRLVSIQPFRHGLVFTDGQTALVVTPSGISAGIISIEVEEYGDLRNITATMNDVFYFRNSTV